MAGEGVSDGDETGDGGIQLPKRYETLFETAGIVLFRTACFHVTDKPG